jgi:hypothetical protein
MENGCLKTRIEVKGDRNGEHTESRPGASGDNAYPDDPLPQQQGSQASQKAGEQDHYSRIQEQALNVLTFAHRQFFLHVLANTELDQKADEDKNREEKGIDTQPSWAVGTADQHEQQEGDSDIDCGFPNGEDIVLGLINALGNVFRSPVLRALSHVHRLLFQIA